MARRIHALDTKVRLRVALGAVVTWHSLALDDTRRIGAGANGAGTTVLGVAVRVGTAVESVALHDALKATTFGRACHLDLLARSEDFDRHLVAKIVSRDVFLVLGQLRVVKTKAAQNQRCDAQTSLRRVTDYSFVRATAAWRALAFLRLARVPLLAEAELDRIEPDLILLQDFGHRVRSRLHNGARDLLSLLIEDLGHPQLPTNNADH